MTTRPPHEHQAISAVRSVRVMNAGRYPAWRSPRADRAACNERPRIVTNDVTSGIAQAVGIGMTRLAPGPQSCAGWVE
jgi:hypothetical protein